MNWWGRRTGLSLILIVVLFSCEEDISTIGFKNPDTKFRVNYAEIDVPSSVFRVEKLTSYNRASSDDGIQRFLIGQYQDPEFGTVRTEIYSQISPPTSYRKVSAGATLDSLVLQLKTDFYHYGSKTASDQFIQVHELSDSIRQAFYYNTSKVPYKPEVLGEKTITVDPVEFDQYAANNSDNVTTNNKIKNFRMVLDNNFAASLLETVKTDSLTTYDYRAFTKKFKGLAIIPSASDKIFGIDPTITDVSLAGETTLILYFTESGVQQTMNFVLYPVGTNPILGFSSIESNTSGTALQSMTEPFADFFPSNNKRYVQSGIGVLTKLDFSKFFEYMDTVKNPVLNSAELVFETELGDFPAPTAFQLKALTDGNKYLNAILDSLKDGATTQYFDPALYPAYQKSLVFNTSNGQVDLMGDAVASTPLYFGAGTTNSISVFATEFFQTQYKQRENEKKIKYFAFHPQEGQFRKSVGRFIMKDNIKLKVYYTTPVVEIIE